MGGEARSKADITTHERLCCLKMYGINIKGSLTFCKEGEDEISVGPSLY